ncbi:hypothetical protein U9M48_041364 [Paspalum notatum var. saurae]
MATLSWLMEWSVEKVREAFFSYFGENQHVRLPSTPVIPVDDPKVPLLHTCLHRFKVTPSGRERHRTCFSLRCIIASGDEDLIDRFRIDATFHRFTEILGSWSHGYYFKEEAIGLLFSLLTEVDFWMAGETGPCGPCIGFFLDCSDNSDGIGSVRSITDGKLVEICRLVFVEFDRQADGVLEPLQAKHVLTGINLECLAAILQKKESHYDLDVYADVICNVYSHTCKGFKDYSGKVGAADTDGVDTAYRLVADHMRMIAVTNAPGSQLGLGNEGREYFLKCADKQAVQYGYEVLKINEEGYDIVVHGILLNEPDLCTELEEEIIDRIVKDEVMIYKKTKSELEQNLELSEFNKQVLGVLPKLTCSLYFDVTFSSSCGFEQTFETALFGFLGVPLRHGWLVDPQDAELNSSIRRSSYSKLSYNLAMYESIRPNTNSGPQKHGRYEDDMFYSALAFSKTGSEKELGSTSCATISTFLQGPQLTRYGFSSLHNDLRALQPTVLIWNEKLITISKFEDKIYVLLNDLSLLSTETDAVWERLTQATGDGVFVDCNFVPTDSKIQSVLPLTKTERKKRIKEKMDLKKEEDSNNNKDDEKTKDKDDEETKDKDDETTKDKDDEDTKEDDGKEEDSNEDRDDEETEEKDDGNAAPTYFLQGRLINLKIRPIDFLGLSTHVIHQINDGPCALIAVCNVLLLRGAISFEPHETVVSMEYLLGLVLALLGGSVKMQDYSDERKSQIVDAVQSLAGGFDMDVIFTRMDGFTMTPEWLLLDCLDLNLRHGWIAATDLLTGPEVSFESLTLASNEPGFPHEEIKNFLRGPQLTPIGLVSLQEDLVENVPCILFWNKHYHTIVKINGVLNSLVTDSNYLETRVVWQTLDGVNGDGVYLDSNFTPIYMGLDAAASVYRDGYGSHFVPTEEDTSHEKSVPGPQFVHETREMSLEDFIQITGNEFSEAKTIFAGGTSLEVADTTKIGRVFGLDLLEEMIFSHNAGFSWNGQFDLSTIVVIDGVDGVRAEIRAPYCDKFSEKAKFNDYFSYIHNIIELYRIKGVGLPAFFTHLVKTLSKPPCRPLVCSPQQLEGYRHRLHGFWDCVLTTLALRSSLARAGLYSGIHRIRRFAPSEVRRVLRSVLSSTPLKDDWRDSIAQDGHPVLKKVLRYIPGEDESNKKVRENEDGARKYGLYIRGEDESNKKVQEDEYGKRKYGLYERDAGSLSIFPRQVNEHGKRKPKEDERQQEEEEPFNKLSELDLLSSKYLEDYLPVVLQKLLCSDHLMTHELWEWLEEVLEDYMRSEVLGRETWNPCRRVFGGRSHGDGSRGHGHGRGF